MTRKKVAVFGDTALNISLVGSHQNSPAVKMGGRSNGGAAMLYNNMVQMSNVSSIIELLPNTKESKDRAKDLRQIPESDTSVFGYSSQIQEFDTSVFGYSIQAVGRWVKKKSKIKDEDADRFFIADTISLVEMSDTADEGPDEYDIPHSKEMIKEADIVGIYSVHATGTFQFSEDDIANLFKEDAIVVVRSKLFEKTKFSQFVEMIKPQLPKVNAILLLTADNLRDGNLNIKKHGLSWEKLAEETITALSLTKAFTITTPDNPKEHVFKYVLVCFDSEGFLLWNTSGGNKDFQMYAYCDEIENDFSIKHNHFPPCKMTTMQTELIVSLAESSSDNRNLDNLIIKAAARGLSKIRKLIVGGFTNRFKDSEGNIFESEWPLYPVADLFPSSPWPKDDANLLHFDLHSLGEYLNLVAAGNMLHSNQYSRLTVHISNDSPNDFRAINDMCMKIVKDGIGKEHKDFPFAHYGKLICITRKEIEEFRGIYHSLNNYKANATDVPLSISVFGAPGTGKSFGVKEISKAVFPEAETITANLSQIKDPDELADIFQLARDAGLKGKVPVIFFDEFDSNFEGKNLGWLKYFLAPMQDGLFWTKGRSHVVGKAVFVFAGSIFHSREEFNSATGDNHDTSKLRDFISRLKTNVNILGPNEPSGTTIGAITRKIRRAALLRSMLEKRLNINDKDHINIADNVVQAFLDVENYINEARSMEAILSMSSINTSELITSSCITQYANEFAEGFNL